MYLFNLASFYFFNSQVSIWYIDHSVEELLFSKLAIWRIGLEGNWSSLNNLDRVLRIEWTSESPGWPIATPAAGPPRVSVGLGPQPQESTRTSWAIYQCCQSRSHTLRTTEMECVIYDRREEWDMTLRWGRIKEEKLGDKDATFHALLARMSGSATHFTIPGRAENGENEFSESKHSHPSTAVGVHGTRMWGVQCWWRVTVPGEAAKWFAVACVNEALSKHFKILNQYLTCKTSFLVSLGLCLVPSLLKSPNSAFSFLSLLRQCSAFVWWKVAPTRWTYTVSPASA